MKRIPLLALVLAVLLTGCTVQPPAPVTQSTDPSPATIPTPPPSTQPAPPPSTQPADPFANALFIGDSRTVGLMEYGGIQGADFFATVGMSIFSLQTSRVFISSQGDVTLSQLLAAKKYDRIFLMTGINELGYPMQSILDRYRQTVELLRRLQPDAQLFLEGNLRVTQALSSTSDIFTNGKIDQLNRSIAAMADNRQVFYLDVNPLFDDGRGNLDEQYASDHTHLQARHYRTWVSWLTQQALSHT